jgi:hypothetical protein
MAKQMNQILHKNAKGETKYYASYQSAWNACIKLNKKETNGVWRFEADLVGWYLQLEEE